jgi:hypothetical protein
MNMSGNPVVNASMVGKIRELLRNFKKIRQSEQPGTDVSILKIFSPKKNLAKKRFFAQTTSSSCKNLIITLVLKKNAIFSPKII